MIGNPLKLAWFSANTVLRLLRLSRVLFIQSLIPRWIGRQAIQESEMLALSGMNGEVCSKLPVFFRQLQRDVAWKTRERCLGVELFGVDGPNPVLTVRPMATRVIERKSDFVHLVTFRELGEQPATDAAGLS